MRRISILLAALAVSFCVCATEGTQTDAALHEFSRRPIFVARSLATPQQRDALLKRGPFYGVTQFDTSLETLYSQIDPEKSLFIHDCSGWCDDAAVSFDTQLLLAASFVDAQHKQDVVKAWKKSANALLAPSSVPSTFLLQAVVNRLDLATVRADGKTGDNAELHLVYAPADPSTYFQVIVEFVLKPIDLRNVAGQWAALKPYSGQDLGSRLEQLIQNLPPASARVRTNTKPVGAQWFVSQWDFKPGVYPTQSTLLPDQILLKCQQHPGDCPSWIDVWNKVDEAAAKGPLPSNWPIADTAILSPSDAGYIVDTVNPQQTLGIPDGLQNRTLAGRTRDLLVLQQCTFCHGKETNTQFRHVLPRGNPGTTATASGLSCFLTGNMSGRVRALPSFDQLNKRDPQVVCQAPLQFNAPSGVIDPDATACGTGFLCKTRTYNELARRAAAMASMQLLYVSPPTRTRVIEPTQFAAFRQALIESYSTHMKH